MSFLSENTLEAKTRRWWFFVGLIALQFLVAPFASKNFDVSKWGDIIGYTFGHALFYACKPAFPVFQVIAIAVFLLLLVLRNKARVLLSLHAGLSYVLFAVLQNVAIAPKYGLSIVIVNIVMFLLVAATWWDGVLHLPLLVLSVLGLVLSMRRIERAGHNNAVQATPRDAPDG